MVRRRPEPGEAQPVWLGCRSGAERGAAHTGSTRGTPPRDSSSWAPSLLPSLAKKLPVSSTPRGGQISSTEHGQALSAAPFFCAYQRAWNRGNHSHFYVLKNSDSFFLPKPTTWWGEEIYFVFSFFAFWFLVHWLNSFHVLKCSHETTKIRNIFHNVRAQIAQKATSFSIWKKKIPPNIAGLSHTTNRMQWALF